ncbi:MAG: hypothetical protein KKA05_10340 [Alphaproteobacteria bacterium]|nr:hypothetical protein [Alphaproteobacteria bacterium]
MADALDIFRENLPARPFQWRTSEGLMLKPSSMVTRHLFYTLRMIWNHSVPERCRVGKSIRLYTFGEFYTADYMRLAVRFIGTELMGRDDLADWQRRELFEIASWLRSDSFTIIHPLSGPRRAIAHG